jgi:hypothetical protein
LKANTSFPKGSCTRFNDQISSFQERWKCSTKHLRHSNSAAEDEKRIEVKEMRVAERD